MTNKPMLSVERELRTLAEKACGTAKDSTEYRRFLEAVSPTVILDLTAEPAAQNQGEPVELDERVLYDAWRGSNLGYVRPFNKYEWSAWKARARIAEQPAPVAEVMPFAEKVIAKLQRFEACVSDGQDVDIDRHWFDVLTQLELLRRVQRSPAYWEMTQQGEDALKATRLNSPQ